MTEGRTRTAPAPAATVPIIPEGKVVFGIQLPIQSQSTIYVRGLGDLARVRPSWPGWRARPRSPGFFYVAVCDHTSIPRRLAAAMSTTWYDTVATLGWLAGITSRVRLMSHVYVAALRHPLRAAKEFATLDVLSGGRVIIGVGAGHVHEEFDLFGPPFDDRGRALDESIDAHRRRAGRRVPRRCPGPGGRPAIWGSRPGPSSSPGPRSGWGARRVPRLRRAAPRGDGWLPQTRRSDMRDQVAELLELREEFARRCPHRHRRAGRGLPRGRADRELPAGDGVGEPRRGSPRTWPSSSPSACRTSSSGSPTGRWRSCATRWPPSASRWARSSPADPGAGPLALTSGGAKPRRPPAAGSRRPPAPTGNVPEAAVV